MRYRQRTWACLVVGWLWFADPGPCHSQGAETQGSVPARVSHPSLPWRTPEVVDYALTGMTVVGGFWLRAENQGTVLPRWDRDLPLDQPVRDFLRNVEPEARARAAAVSDVLEVTLVFAPNLVGVPLAWGQYGPAAAELLVIHAQVMATTGFIIELSKLMVQRGRPYYRRCADPVPEEEALCLSGEADESMISGHAAYSSAGAALLCVHQERLHLVAGVPGTVMCLGAIGAALATSALRVVSDRHYPTDVLAGAVVGFAVGYWLPQWRFYAEPDQASATASVVPSFTLAGGSIGGLGVRLAGALP